MEQVKIDWKKKNYTATWGVMKFKGNAQTVAHEIEAIGESVTRQQLVDYAAEHEDTELYKCFQWDDSIAANHYRVQQAGTILNSLKIAVIEKPGENPKPTNVNVFSSTEHRNAEYRKTEVIVTNIDSYQALLEKAIDELKWFKKKYQTLSELEPVFATIDAL